MEYLFIGVDISKDVLDYAIIDQNSKATVNQGQIENSLKGVNQFIKQLKKLQKVCWLCAEHTGHYGSLLVACLEDESIRYSMVNSLEIIRSSGLSRGKSDRIDAERIGIYAATHAHKLVPASMPCETIRRIKILLASRDQYVKFRTAMKNTLNALEITNKTLDLKKEIRSRKKEIKGMD